MTIALKQFKFVFALVVSLMLCTSFYTFAQHTEADNIMGVWEVGSKKAHVKITKYGDKYAGKIIWLREPNYADGTPKLDKNNTDESKRKTPILGHTNLIGFKYAGSKKWKDGTIYDPENGKTYKCVISMTNENTIEVRGFVGITLIGRTDTWKRVVGKE